MAVRSPRQCTDLITLQPIHGQLLQLIASILQDLASAGDIDESPFATVFHAESVPRVRLIKYLERIATWCFCESDTIVLALIYIERVSKSLTITSQCIHRQKFIQVIIRVLLSAVVLAIKYNEEKYYQNQYYARVGGIPLEELNRLEKELLLLLDYHLYVDESEFEQYKFTHLGDRQY